MNRLKQKYQEEIVPQLMSQFGLKNRLAAPRLVKMVVSTSFKEDQHQDEAVDIAKKWLAAITGQLPRTAVAKQSIAGFNVREGDTVGLQVTLRGGRMWDFIDRFISLTLPRVRDFQGVPLDSFDGKGNYTIGLTEQIIFPEVDYDSAGKIRGLQVTFVTDTNDDKISRKLFELMGMPFEKE